DEGREGGRREGGGDGRRRQNRGSRYEGGYHIGHLQVERDEGLCAAGRSLFHARSCRRALGGIEKEEYPVGFPAEDGEWEEAVCARRRAIFKHRGSEQEKGGCRRRMRMRCVYRQGT